MSQQRAQDSQSTSRISGSTASKKVRMTMACERCRSKKVKCDFAHPCCSRCQQAKVQCSYDGSATQIDLFNLVKLNETVDMLQQRVQSIESDMKDVSTNTQFVADEFRMTRSSERNHSQSGNFSMNSLFASSTSSNEQWSLSLTPRGLRIDTSIMSLHDLYDILLTGISRLDLEDTPMNGCCKVASESDASSQASSSTSIPEIDRTTIARKKSLWKTKLKTFPLYSTWEPHLEEVCKDHARDNNEATPEMMSSEMYDQLMDIYVECLLCLPCADPDDSVADRYHKGTLDPLVMNAALAWTARHAAIYHGLFPTKDPNKVGEPFFEKAKEILKERFTTTNIDTMHGLIMMYVYAIGRPGERRNSTESEAYIYLGLAIRMCLNMKMFQESNSPDPIMREKHRRFFWAVYFLETLCTIHSDKAFSLPSEDLITVAFPTVLPHETGEKQWRVHFTSQRFRITRIYRKIINKTSLEKPLLSSISTLDKELHDWYDDLPAELKYSPGDIDKRDWQSASFREQACIKLNSEYNFQLCQLYSLFASRPEESQPSAIDLLTKERCRSTADNIVELLDCFSKLKQRWCHFSLETTMIASLVYSTMLEGPKPDYARQQLSRMLRILSASPVRHHKYVYSLTKRIETILAEQRPDVDLDLDEEEQQPVEASSKRVIAGASSTIVEAKQVLEASPAPSPAPCMQQVKVDMLDMPTALFDLAKETAVDPLQFLYTPSVMGLCTAPPPPHDSLMNMSTPTPQSAVVTTATTHGGYATPTTFGSPSTSMTYYSSSSSPPYHMPPHQHQHWQHGPFGNYSPDQPVPHFVNMETLPMQHTQPHSKKRNNNNDFAYYQ